MEQVLKAEENKKNKNKELTKLAKAQSRVHRTVKGQFILTIYLKFSFFWANSYVHLNYFLMQRKEKERK